MQITAQDPELASALAKGPQQQLEKIVGARLKEIMDK